MSDPLAGRGSVAAPAAVDVPSALARVLAALWALHAADALAQAPALSNPYARVDWAAVSHYRADLHVHTIQSDGCHLPEEVVRVYHEAGFDILALTDHDPIAPNRCPLREHASPGQIEFGAFTDRHSPYPSPRPANFPANTTWPWTDFGAPLPAALGMLGLQASEMTCGHHMSAFFHDYGVQSCDEAPEMDAQLREVARLGGLAFVNHPDSRSKEEFAQLFRAHPADFLVGMELSRGAEEAAALWDQLLGEQMPARPIWGFATSDMHVLVQTQFAFTVFVLDDLDEGAVKEALRAGQFYSVVGPATMDLREAGRAAYEGTWPELRAISVNRVAAEIAIDAANYDEIVWIGRPESGRPSTDEDGNVSWPAGTPLGRGPVFSYADLGAQSPYLRAEVIKQSENGPIRLFLNPFALTAP